MLQLIRDKATGVVAWVIFGFIALAFTLWGANGFIFSNSSNSVAANVSGHKIPWGVIDQQVQMQMRAMPNYDDIDLKKLRQNVRRDYVDNYALRLQLRDKGFTVNDSFIISNVFSQSQFFEDGKFSNEKYQKLLSQNGITDSQYQEQIRSALLEQQPKIGMILSSFMLEEEIDALFALFNQTREVAYTVISKDKFSTTEISVEQVSNYYQNNKSEFTLPEQITVNYLTLSAEDVRQDVEVTDEKLQKFYDDRLSDYSIPEMVRVRHIFIKAPEGSTELSSGEARVKAEDILAKLKLNENSFDELLTKFSEDKSSQAGDLGWIRKGEVDPAFEKASFALQDKLSLSDVVMSPFGFHILELTDRKEAIVKEISLVLPELKERYIEESSKNILFDRVDELANIAFESQHEPIDIVAERMNLNVNSAVLTKEHYDNSVLNIPLVQKELFADGGLKDTRIISEPIKISDSQYAVIKVVKIMPAAVQDLDLVQEEILAKLQQEDIDSQVIAYGNSAVSRFNDDNKPFEYLSTKEFKWNNIANLKRADDRLDSPIIDAVFSVSQHEGKKVQGIKLEDGRYLVVSLIKVQPGTIDDASDRQELLKAMSANVGELEYQLYRNSLINSTAIKLYN
ncbi:MAG: hypothetical protein HOI53_04205 [Francisellaceae bacterium]|jgi:peptidyl-prolyl cis-trans isomerase D|nr:hypothetical protein [Francisellaceae bacterium]MBT6538406.1 hypothetical protein [Francisellaceae bacterium]